MTRRLMIWCCQTDSDCAQEYMQDIQTAYATHAVLLKLLWKILCQTGTCFVCEQHLLLFTSVAIRWIVKSSVGMGKWFGNLKCFFLVTQFPYPMCWFAHIDILLVMFRGFCFPPGFDYVWLNFGEYTNISRPYNIKLREIHHFWPTAETPPQWVCPVDRAKERNLEGVRSIGSAVWSSGKLNMNPNQD